MVAYSSTSDLLSDAKRFRMFARTVPSDKYQCLAMADLIDHYNWTFVTIIHSPEAYGTNGAAELIRLLKGKNITVDKQHGLPDIEKEDSPDILDKV